MILPLLDPDHEQLKRHVNVMTYDIASAAVTDNSECVLILSTLLREEDEETKVF